MNTTESQKLVQVPSVEQAGVAEQTQVRLGCASCKNGVELTVEMPFVEVQQRLAKVGLSYEISGEIDAPVKDKKGETVKRSAGHTSTKFVCFRAKDCGSVCPFIKKMQETENTFKG